MLVEERERLVLELGTRMADFPSLKRNQLVALVRFLVKVRAMDSALLDERMEEISRLESQLVSAESGVLVLPLLLCVEEDAAADSGVRCSQVESQHSETQTMTEDFVSVGTEVAEEYFDAVGVRDTAVQTAGFHARSPYHPEDFYGGVFDLVVGSYERARDTSECVRDFISGAAGLSRDGGLLVEEFQEFREEFREFARSSGSGRVCDVEVKRDDVGMEELRKELARQSTTLQGFVGRREHMELQQRLLVIQNLFCESRDAMLDAVSSRRADELSAFSVKESDFSQTLSDIRWHCEDLQQALVVLAPLLAIPSSMNSLRYDVGEVRKCLVDLTTLRAPYAREIQGSGTPRGSFYAAGTP